MKRLSYCLFYIFLITFLVVQISCSNKNIPSNPDTGPTNTPTMNPTQIFGLTMTVEVADALKAQQTAIAKATQDVKMTQTCIAGTATQIVKETRTQVALEAAQTAAVIATMTATVFVPTRTELTTMINVPSGTFTQCCDSSGNSFNHSLSAFKIAKYEMTYKIFREIHSWASNRGYLTENGGYCFTTPSDTKPVIIVNWNDAVVWCNAYSEYEGLTPVYYNDPTFTNVTKDGTYDVYPYVNWQANGYRLPTEGEWMYAASYVDGTSWTPGNYASGASDDYVNSSATSLVAWYGVQFGYAYPVGLKQPNALGIYDMSGNAKEWTWDRSGDYPTTPQFDYKGYTTGYQRVAKGGSFFNIAQYITISRREMWAQYGESSDFGFRVAQNVP